MSASCSQMHGCGSPTQAILKGCQMGKQLFLVIEQSLPESLYYVRGGRGPSIRIRLPGKGDGGAGDIGQLRFGRGAGNEVWISGPVGLNLDSKLFMLKTKNRINFSKQNTYSGFLLFLPKAYHELLSRLSTRPPHWVWRQCTHTCQCHRAEEGETKTVK